MTTQSRIQFFEISELTTPCGELIAIGFDHLEGQEVFEIEDVDAVLDSRGVNFNAFFNSQSAELVIPIITELKKIQDLRLENDLPHNVGQSEEIFSVFKSVLEKVGMSLIFFFSLIILSLQLTAQDDWTYTDNTFELCDALFYVYGIPHEITYGIAMHESGKGTSRKCKENHNWFGLGGDINGWQFVSKDECFWAFGRSMERDFNCIDKDYKVMLRCLAENGYAEDEKWEEKVLNHIDEFINKKQ